MRKMIYALALLATPALAATDIVMHRDPGCGCCEKWAACPPSAPMAQI